MSPETVQTLSLDALEEHASWMRGLVARLVHDSGRVDDVVQDAWAAALVNPPPAGLPLKAWLSGIVKRSTLASRRGDARRRDRETQRTLDDARSGRNVAGDVADLSACADEQRALMESITELPEGEKAVLLLRFYEGLPPREIAARLDLPVNTVRTRQRLGLDRLRSELDRRHGGDASTWAALLLPLSRALPGRSMAASAGSFSGAIGGASVPVAILRFLALGLAGLGVVLGARHLLRPSEEPSLAQVTSPEVALAELSRLAAPTANGPSASRRALAIGASMEGASHASVFRGSVVDRAGQPIGGAKLDRADAPKKNAVSAVSDSSSSPAWLAADSQGQFEGRAPAGDGVQWVRSRHPGYLQVAQAVRLSAGEPATVTMVRTAITTLEIEVVDLGSRRPCGTFRAHSAQWLDSMGEGYHRYSVFNESAAAEAGRVRIETRYAVDRPISVSVRGVVGMFGQVVREDVRAEVTAIEGGVTRVRFELDLDGPETSGRFPVAHGTVVDAGTGEPVEHAVVAVKGALMSYPDEDPDHSEIRTRRVESDEAGVFRTAIPLGTTRAAARVFHPGYVPRDVELSTDGLEDSVVALQPRGDLRGVVLDREGRPVAGAPLLILLPEMEGRDDRLRLLTESDGAFVVPDLLKGRVHVYVLEKSGDADEEALASDSFRVESGVSRDVEVRTDRPERVHVTGQVTESGQVLSGVVPAFLPTTDEGGWTIAKGTRYGFDAGGMDRGTYLVALLPADEDASTSVTAWIPGVEVHGLGAQRIAFEVPSLEVSGRVVLAPGSSLSSGLRVVAIPAGVGGFAGEMLGRPKVVEAFGHPVDAATGAFTLPRLTRGSYRVELWSTGEGEPTVLASRDLEVAGSVRLGDWVIAP